MGFLLLEKTRRGLGFALAVLMAWPVLAFGQVKEVKSFRKEMQVVKSEGWLRVSFDFPEVFTARLREHLSNGFRSHILVGVQLLSAREGTPLAQGLLDYTILYEIWEEKFFVRLQGHDRARDLQLLSMNDLVQACSGVKNLALIPIGAILDQKRFKLEVRIQVNPTSPEQMKKVREYLANPDGGGVSGSVKFFGSFSRIFLNEKDFQADAVYTYRSPEFALPSG